VVKQHTHIGMKHAVVQEGDVYVFLVNMTTRAGFVHPAGSRLYVHDATKDTPFDELGPDGVNWYCRTQFDLSIWSTLEQGIERFLFARVSSEIPNRGFTGNDRG
jgi:hypothetical protein